MKMKFLLMFLLVLASVIGCSVDEPGKTQDIHPEEPSEPVGDKKSTVRVFLSYRRYTDNSRLHTRYVKSNLVELETEDTYTDDYDTLLEQIRQEVANEYCLPLKTRIGDILSYDIICVGYPIWVETAAPPVRTFLTSCDLSGKTVLSGGISHHASSIRS